MKIRKTVGMVSLCMSLALCSCGTSQDAGAAAVEEESAAAVGVESPLQETEDTAEEETDTNGNFSDTNGGQAKLLSRLEKAYNEEDIYAVIECFDPMIMNAYYAGIKFFGVDADAIKGLMPFASKLIAQSGMIESAYWGSVELIPLDYSGDAQSGMITYQVNLSYADGTSKTLEDTASIKNVDGEWYFAAVQPVRNQDLAPIPVIENLTDEDVEGGLFAFSENGYIGYVNERGKVIIEPYFYGGRDSIGKYCPVRMEWTWGFIDVYGNMVVEYGFEDVGEYCYDGYWPVKMNGAWGYINLENGNTISCDYSEYGYFSDGVAPVKKDKYWGAIDVEGNKVVDFIYDKMTAGKKMFNPNKYDYRELSFVSGVIGVEVNGVAGVIKANGNYLIPLNQDNENTYMIGDDFVAMQMDNSEDNYLFRISTGSKIPTPEYHAVIGAIGDTIYLHGAIGSGIRGCNAIAIDVDGNVVLDTVESIYYNLGIDTGYNPNTGFGAFGLGDHTTWLFHEWTLVYIHTDGSSAVIGNFVNDKGELLFPVWMREITFSDSYVAGYTKEDGITYLYDSTNGEISEYEGYYIMGGDYFLIESADARDSSQGRVINIKTGETLNVDVVKEESDSALIVTDGIFYGLYTVNGFVGEGMKYNKIEYHDYSDVYSMELGADTVQYRIGRDGTINII